MNEQDKMINEQALAEIEDVINEIEEQSKQLNSECLYRGEARLHNKVCSGIYRDYDNINEKTPDVSYIQSQIVKKHQEYLPYSKSTDDYEILSDIQHFGGKTNLIDFTSDINVALYFACNKAFEDDGRVIILKKEKNDNYEVKTPYASTNRKEDQKSVFVESKEGYIEPDHVVLIPVNLKVHIRAYLKGFHAISQETIYNDVHGLLTAEDIQPYFIEYEKAKKKMDKQLENGEVDYKDENVNAEIKDITRHLELVKQLNPKFVNAYNDLVLLHTKTGKFDGSIKYCDEALEQNLDIAKFNAWKGQALNLNGEYEAANEHLNRAIMLDDSDPYFYYLRCENNMRILHSAQDQNDKNIQISKQEIYEVTRIIKSDLKSLHKKESQSDEKYINLLMVLLEEGNLYIPEDVRNLLMLLAER